MKKSMYIVKFYGKRSKDWLFFREYDNLNEAIKYCQNSGGFPHIVVNENENIIWRSPVCKECELCSSQKIKRT